MEYSYFFLFELQVSESFGYSQCWLQARDLCNERGHKMAHNVVCAIEHGISELSENFAFSKAALLSVSVTGLKRILPAYDLFKRRSFCTEISVGAAYPAV